MRVISVVMGAPTSKERNNQVTKLLDYAFGQYMTKKLYTRGEKIKTVQVGKGKKKSRFSCVRQCITSYEEGRKYGQGKARSNC